MFYLEDYYELCNKLNITEEKVIEFINLDLYNDLNESYTNYLINCEKFNKSPMLFEEYTMCRERIKKGLLIGTQPITLNEKKSEVELHAEYAIYSDRMVKHNREPLTFDMWVLKTRKERKRKIAKTLALAGAITAGAIAVNSYKKGKFKDNKDLQKFGDNAGKAFGVVKKGTKHLVKREHKR